MNGAGGSVVENLLATRVVQLLIAVLASGLAAWLIASGNTRMLTAAIIGLIGLAALMRWPALTVISLLIVCQELDPSQGFGGASGSGLLFLGHQVYYTTVARVTLLTLLLVLTAARVLTTARGSRPRRGALMLVLALGAYYTALLWIQGTSLTSAINQDSRFVILFAACFAIGVGASQAREWQKHAVPVLLCVVSGMALLGLYLTAAGQGEVQGGTNLIFYDSALGAVTGAIVLAAISTPPADRDWRIWCLGGAALIVVILSSRRNVWAAMAVALLVGLMFGRNRMRFVLRLASALALLVVVLAVLKPSVLTAVGHQLSAIWGATQGTASDASTAGHLSDVSNGWNAVKASPFSGVGPNGHVPGLVVESGGPLYIHNQVLESWLRFGLIGAVLIVAIQVAFVVQALRVIKRPGPSFTLNWAAQLLIMAPIAMLTAPFFTNTQRWPAILGFAAGLVASVRPGDPSAAAPD